MSHPGPRLSKGLKERKVTQKQRKNESKTERQKERKAERKEGRKKERAKEERTNERKKEGCTHGGPIYLLECREGGGGGGSTCRVSYRWLVLLVLSDTKVYRVLAT